MIKRKYEKRKKEERLKQNGMCQVKINVKGGKIK
jgi:hypothetical protein